MGVFTKNQKSWVTQKENSSSSYVGLICINLYKYKFLRNLCIKLIKKNEGSDTFSKSLRLIFKKYHKVTIGSYSYGSCFIPNLLPSGTVVGSYCSIAAGLKVFRRNHPLSYLSQHPFFYNSKLGLVDTDKIISNKDNPLIIGHDVWVGDSVIILPSCKKIGNGAVVGAGSVVTKDIGDFEIVAGNPAKKIKDRYSEDIKDKVIVTKWWNKSLLELLDAESLLKDDLNYINLCKFLSRNVE